jgi:ribosomal protein L11 methyltransferase
MDYVEVTLTITPYTPGGAEILTAYLADLGFDTFVDTPDGIQAYIPQAMYSAQAVEGVLQGLKAGGMDVEFQSTHIPDQNWNTKWESNFDPISIEDLCYIRAPFHASQQGYRVEVVIEPRMAFGTGHHQTTWLMAQYLFSISIEGMRVLDMGCGTGVLAIIAKKTWRT